jgi:hypothetical protein
MEQPTLDRQFVGQHLYRSVKPNQLQTKYRFRGGSNPPETVTFAQLLQNEAVPKLLGSFRLDPGQNEVELLDADGNVNKKWWGQFLPSEICSIRRIGDEGLSCFTEEACLANVPRLPPISDATIDTDHWYYLESEAIPENPAAADYLNFCPDDTYIPYNGQNCVVFLYFRLTAGTELPTGFEADCRDNEKGHWRIRRTDFDTFEAVYCRIGGLRCAMIPGLVHAEWTFQGLKLHAATEPLAYRSSYDKQAWTLAAIIHEHFGCLSTEELVGQAVRVLSHLSAEGYTAECCVCPIIGDLLVRVLDDVFSECDMQQLDAVVDFKDRFRSLQEVILK